jgi:FSR family fosmidomycin resistance protein-like MFS transporter
MVRSVSYIGLVSFIPLYFVGVVHTSPWVANMILTTFLVAGIAGTLAGGSLADTHGRRGVILASMAGTVVCVFLFAETTNAPVLFSIIAGFAVAIVMGIFVMGSQAATIVLGQEYLPNRMGMASGVTLGLGVSVGGMFTPVLGAIADHYGLHASILAIGALSALALAVGFTMPNPEKRRARLLARGATVA